MFEHRSDPLLNRLRFVMRLGRALLLTVFIFVLSVLGGTLGYRMCVGHSWSDSFHHACLVLGEHLPKEYPQTPAGKVFSGIYIMYARLVFVSVVAILILPLFHRILHKLHLDTTVAASGDAAKDVT